jgi:SAM-dependent methyltransferase
MNAVFTRIYQRNGWNGARSVSGPGSEEDQTRSLIPKLEVLIRDLGIASILDIPCGDFNWMKDVNLRGVDYIGADIVKALVAATSSRYSVAGRRFECLNLLADGLPDADLVISRDCLVHFSNHDVFLALGNICQGSSKYLLTTTFPDRSSNIDIVTGEWRPINLQAAPFSFPDPEHLIVEGCTESDDCQQKSLGLWRVDVVREVLLHSYR